MSKDPLLTEKFFLLERTASELVFNQQSWIELNQLIKQKLYPHLLNTEQRPIYYRGEQNFEALKSFSYLGDSSVESYDFKALQRELDITINELKSWTERHEIKGAAGLSYFRLNLKHPTDGMTIMYADGKLLLEKVTVLLDDAEIDLDYRKKIATDLLAEKGLEKCIDGCYSRLDSAALQLQENIDNKNQIKQWIRSYTKDTARKIAAQRPFAMPDSYQELICKAANCASLQNMLHANNYLLMEAKRNIFPIDIPRDSGAIELGNRLSESSKTAIVDAYIDVLEQEMTAKNLVDYLSEKLHENFQSILNRDIDYQDKAELILQKLNLLGEDSGFKGKKVGLEEILTDNGQLKEVDALKITVIERLIHRGLLNAGRWGNIDLLDENFQYHRFSTPELTWFWVDDERKPLLQLIKDDRLPSLISVLNTFFIMDMSGFLAAMKHLPVAYHLLLFHPMNIHSVVTLMKMSHSPQHFLDLLQRVPNRQHRMLFLSQCGDEFIRSMIIKGLRNVDFHNVFPGLSLLYKKEDYDEQAIQEGLSITQRLIKKLIANDFKDFSDLIFHPLPFNYLQGIDFSNLNLKGSIFRQTIDGCRFDGAALQGARMNAINQISLKYTDLREVSFQSITTNIDSIFNLDHALLSTEVFIDLSRYYTDSFIGADLSQVNFQDLRIKDGFWALNFAKADLKNVDLSGLDLSSLNLVGTDLTNANLHHTGFARTIIDSQTTFKGSQLDLSSIYYAYHRGIRNFDACKIHLNMNLIEMEDDTIAFRQVSFKSAEFIGENLFALFKECDLMNSLFRPADNSETLTLSIKTKVSQLNNVVFRHVKFVADSEFTDSTITAVFDRVAMSAKVLFEFYAAGQRDFKGVHDLKGAIPTKLMPFPVLEAELNKQTFIHLYRQGLRDFRGSNLNSFYLSQVLTEQAISDIDLKLGGAKSRRSPLVCVSSPFSRRQLLNQAAPCVAHLLLQKEGAVQGEKLVLSDIEAIAQSAASRYLLKETTLESKYFFNLAELNEINFYWGYRVDEETLYQAFLFTRESTLVSERASIKLRYYLFQRFNDNEILITLARNLAGIGFSDCKFNYYNAQTEFFMLQFKDGIKFPTVATPPLANKKLRTFLNVHHETAKLQSKEPLRDRLHRISAELKRKTQSGVRRAGRSGAKYEIGAAIIYLVGEAINHPDTPEPQFIDAQSKVALKKLARTVTEQRGSERGANDRLIETVLELTERCIDRGECADEESVMRESIQLMDRSRPDLMVGNEVLWNKTKVFFSNVGDYVSDRFGEVKQFFDHSTYNVTIPYPFGPNSLSLAYAMRRSKRKLVTWYQSPILMRLIKEIEASFDCLGYDLQRDDRYSEEMLAGILYALWQVCDRHNISGHTEPEIILTLLNEDNFIQEVVNSTATVNPIFAETAPITAEVNSTVVMTPARRSKRAISFTKPTKQQNDAARIDQIADDYEFKWARSQLQKRPMTQSTASNNKKIGKTSAQVQSMNRFNEPAQAISRLVQPKKMSALFSVSQSKNKEPPAMPSKKQLNTQPLFHQKNKLKPVYQSDEFERVNNTIPSKFYAPKLEGAYSVKANNNLPIRLISSQSQEPIRVSRNFMTGQFIQNTLFLGNLCIQYMQKNGAPSRRERYLQQRAEKQVQNKKENFLERRPFNLN